MQAARRLYLYAMSGITLGVVAVGLAILFDVLLVENRLLEHPYEAYVNVRQQLSQAIAMLGVGLPVWAIHWAFVQRGLRRGAADRDAERGSAIRAAYLTLVLLASLVAWASGAVSLLTWVVAKALPNPLPYFYVDPVSAATTLGVGFVVWLYHGAVRRVDLGQGPVSGPAAWIPRLYLYGVGIGALTAAVTGLAVAANSTFAPPAFDEGYSRQAAIEGAMALVVWGPVWAGHWWYAGRIAVTGDWRGAEEQRSRTRVAAFVATIAIAAALAASAAAELAAAILAPLLGDLPRDAAELPEALIPPLASLVPWAAAWAGYHRGLRRERAATDPLRALHQARLESHAVAAVGLVAMAAGVAWLLGIAIDIAFGGTRREGGFGIPWTYELARWLPLAIIGAVVWTWEWAAVIRRRRRDPEGEANSTIRRTFLFLTVAGGLLAVLSAATLILYRLVGSLLGARLTGNAVSELSTPLGYLVVALVVVSYHGLLVRSDMARRPSEEGTAGGVGLAAEPGAIAALAGGGPPRVRRPLVLVGPEGADLDAAVAGVRAALPPGVELIEPAEDG